MQPCSLCPETDGKRPMAVVDAILAAEPGSTMKLCLLCADCLDKARRRGDFIGGDLLL